MTPGLYRYILSDPLHQTQVANSQRRLKVFSPSGDEIDDNLPSHLTKASSQVELFETRKVGADRRNEVTRKVVRKEVTNYISPIRAPIVLPVVKRLFINSTKSLM